MSDRFEYPPDTLGADLFWWRETGTLHTLVSLYWKEHARLQGAVLRFMLFAESGRRVAEWQVEPVEDQVMLVDSKTPPAVVSAAPTIASGVLAVFVSATGGVGRDDYQRLGGFIDWYSDDGSLCTLHSDQALLDQRVVTRFTEIVVDESVDRQSSLVVLNGPDEQPPGAISLGAAKPCR